MMKQAITQKEKDTSLGEFKIERQKILIRTEEATLYGQM